jgi:toxin YoeB
MYKIAFTKTARREVSLFEKSEPQVFRKIEKILKELALHPYTGTGKPKQLGGDRTGQWSRRITKKHRLVYKVEEAIITVLVLSTYGHYDDK